MFSGSIVALITPFKNGSIDFKALEKIVAWHIQEGTHGLVAAGTTGEAPLLSQEEQRDVIQCVVDQAAGKIPVIAGTSAMTTQDTISLTQQAKDCGVAAALIVTPPYVKPTQDGLYLHYKAVHDAVDLPIILYNNPGRAAVEIGNDCLIKLSALSRIIGVKDATSQLARPTTLRESLPESFIQLTGDDATAAGFLAQGGHGCISVTANIAPRLCAQMQDAWIARDLDTFSELRDRLSPLHRAMFCETSPGPAKYAASLLGLCEPHLRAPLVDVSDATKTLVHKTLMEAGLL